MSRLREVSIRTAILTSLTVFSPCAVTDEIVAILDLKFMEDTGDTAAVMCVGDGDEDCVVWATYYLFEASVDKIISGTLPERRFFLIYGQHALRKKNFRNVVALLKRRDVSDPNEPPYQITQWGKKRKMYCFDRREGEDIDVEISNDGHQQLNCFDPDYYDGRESIEIRR